MKDRNRAMQMESTSKFGLTDVELSIAGGSALLFLAEVLVHYTNWSQPTCIALAALPVQTAYFLLSSLHWKKKAIHGSVHLLVVAVGCFVWWSWSDLHK